MQAPVDVATVRAAAMDDVGFKDRAVLLEPRDPLPDEIAGLFGVVETGAAPAGLHAGAQEVAEASLVMVEVFVEGLDGGGRAPAVVFGERDEHPSHAGCLGPGAVVDVLALDDLLLRARER